MLRFVPRGYLFAYGDGGCEVRANEILHSRVGGKFWVHHYRSVFEGIQHEPQCPAVYLNQQNSHMRSISYLVTSLFIGRLTKVPLLTDSYTRAYTFLEYIQVYNGLVVWQLGWPGRPGSPARAPGLRTSGSSASLIDRSVSSRVTTESIFYVRTKYCTKTT